MDDIQARIDAYYELAEKLQAQEREELSIEEKSKLLVELMDKRKKYFAKLRAEEKRRKPLTQAQKRKQMSTYLKNMAGYTLKEKEAALEQESSSKRQKIDEHEKEEDLKQLMKIADDKEIAVDAIPLATKPLTIVDLNIVKEGKKSYYNVIRADGQSKRPDEDYERVLYGDLKTMFDPHVEDKDLHASGEKISPHNTYNKLDDREKAAS
ncbi:hypothetical protein Tco_0945117 [Tanacetum coccineum]